MRALIVIFALILASPIPGLTAGERGWQAWAFEVRTRDQIGWFGGWTPGVCERFRREAIAELPKTSIGRCVPVMLTDEPIGGLAVWVVATSENAFVATPTPDICEDAGPTFDSEIRPAALNDSSCRRAWLSLPV